jgi:hypothetical protein
MICSWGYIFHHFFSHFCVFWPICLFCVKMASEWYIFCCNDCW